MRRVLIVSPHFAPVNTADMQRVRLLLPWLRQFGWEPTVLAVAPESIEGAVLEPLLEKTYPADIRVVRVRGISPKLTRFFGIGSLWLRCGRALKKAGDKLLRKEAFDLVFFSTTVFGSFSLGPRWLKKFGVPYVLDYHDPWVTDYYQTTGNAPPGGKLKYAFSQWQARRLEPHIVANAAAIVSVSSNYGPKLCSRYSGLDQSRIHHLPFGCSEKDIKVAQAHPPPVPIVPQSDGNVHFVYTGRAGEDMVYSLQLLFRAFYLYKQKCPQKASLIHFHFIGTDYSPPPLGKPRVMPIAEEEHVPAHVHEHYYRIPYFDSLSYLCNADALMIIGSDDPSYSASKVFPYLLARRPLLTIAHEESLMLQLTRGQGYMHSYGFPTKGNPKVDDLLTHKIYKEWFLEKGYKQLPRLRLGALSKHHASNMTRNLISIFNKQKETAHPLIYS